MYDHQTKLWFLMLSKLAVYKCIGNRVMAVVKILLVSVASVPYPRDVQPS